MALTYYHAEPLANSLKSMIPLHEKRLDYEIVYVDLHRFEQRCGVMAIRMFPDLKVDERFPNLVSWRESISDRQALQAALNSEDRTQPGLGTWSGDGRE